MTQRRPILFLLSLGAIAVAAAAPFALKVYFADRSLDRYIATLQARGEPVTLPDLLARLPSSTTESDTIAEVVHRAWVAAEAAPGPISRGVLGITNGLQADFIVGIKQDAIPTTQAYIATRLPALKVLHHLPSAPVGPVFIDYTVSYQSRAEESAKKLQPFARVGQLLHVQAICKLIEGDHDGAALLVPIQLRMTEPLLQEPDPLAHLYAFSLAEHAVSVLESTLAVGTVTPETLDIMERSFQSFSRDLDLEYSLRSERAMLLEDRNWFRESPPLAWLYTRGGVLMSILRDLEQLMEAASSGPGLLAKLSDFEANLPNYDVIVSSSVLTVPSLVKSHLRTQALIRAANAAIHAEKSLASSSGLPRSWQEFLPYSPPIDPFDGKPMKLTFVDGCLAIYSVGQDLQDDGGSIARVQDSRKRTADVGIRLCPSETRGLKLIPVKP